MPEPPIKNPDAQPAPKPAIAPPALTIPRLQRPPAFDDFLSMKPQGEIALQMAKVTGFTQRNPHDGESVSEPTDAYLGYDQKNLYVVFVCFDDPGKVRARMSRREDIYDDDQVEVMLDTFHDRRRAYAFQTTPLGVQWDAIWTEASRDERQRKFRYLVRHRVGFARQSDRVAALWCGWRFRSRACAFPPTKQQEWGIILYRGITRKNEDSFWPHISRKIAGPAGPGRDAVRARRNFSRPQHRTDSLRLDARISRPRYARSHQSLFSACRRRRASRAWTRSSSSTITSSST